MASKRWRGAATYNAGVLKLTGLKASGPNELLTLDGTMPLAWNGGEPVSTGPMDVRAQLEQSDLSVLSLFLPKLEATAGTFKGSLQASGTLEHVVLDGHASIANGLLKFEFMNNAVDHPQVDRRSQPPAAGFEAVQRAHGGRHLPGHRPCGPGSSSSTRT